MSYIFLFNTLKKNNQEHFRGTYLNILVYHLSTLCVEFETKLLTIRQGVNSGEINLTCTSDRKLLSPELCRRGLG